MFLEIELRGLRALVLLSVLGAACAGDPTAETTPSIDIAPFADVESDPDTSVDASADASVNAVVDTIADTPVDAVVDTTADAPVDASGDAPVDAPVDTSADAPVDAGVDVSGDTAEDISVPPDGDADVEDASDASSDTSDVPETPPFEPVVNAELVAISPDGQATPPTWNAHLPKLAGDGDYWYAVHTYFTPAPETRYAAIMARPSAGGPWTEVARVDTPHQPPGVVMDTENRLHMLFECQKPGSADVICFPGGAGTAGNTVRLYHLIFTERNQDGSLRWDTYLNHNEWTAESNGYYGLSTTSDGYTVWTFADSAWQRQIQWWFSSAAYGTQPFLTVPDAYLLYPIQIADPLGGSNGQVFFFGEFDPGGGNNASYLASTAFIGDLSASGMSQLIRRAPDGPVEPGTVAAYPSDGLYGDDGTLYLLNYLPTVDGNCTELLRFDDGLDADPTVVDVGCYGTYVKLQMSSSGTLYLLADIGAGAMFRLGVSEDKGDTWTLYDVPIEGLPPNGDTMFFHATPVKSYTTPTVYDPDLLVFLFSGYDANLLARHTYFGTLELP